MDPYTITKDADLGTVTFNPTKQDVSKLKDLDKPMIVGEYKQSGIWEFNQFYKNGYAGAWPWSINDKYTVYFDAMNTWAKNHKGAL